MPIIDGPLQTVVRVHRSTGKIKTSFESAQCSADVPGELWWERDSPHYVIYQPDEFYDEQLRKRRETDNMISPRDPMVRLVLVAPVHGATCVDPAEWIEVSRSLVSAAG